MKTLFLAVLLSFSGMFSSPLLAAIGSPEVACKFSSSDFAPFFARHPLLAKMVDKAAGIDKLNRILDQIDKEPKYNELSVYEAALKEMGVKFEIEGDLKQLGKEGENVHVVFNHGEGVWNGVLFGYLSKVLAGRSDSKVVYNSLLRKIIPHLDPDSIAVDISSKASSNKQFSAIVEGHSNKGGLTAWFPSGTMSSIHRGDKAIYTNPISRLASARVTDSEWKSSAAHYAIKTGAKVVPVYIKHNGGILWNMLDAIDISIHYLSRISNKVFNTKLYNEKYLRLMFGLINDAVNIRRGTTVKVVIGEALDTKELVPQGTKNRKDLESTALTNVLREKVYELSGNKSLLNGPRYPESRGSMEDLLNSREKYLLENPRNSEKYTKVLIRENPKSFAELKEDIQKVDQDYLPTASETYQAIQETIANDRAIRISKDGAEVEIVIVPGTAMNQSILNRLGFERQKAFSAVGEGSEMKIDVDAHDLIYDHLIILDPKSQEIASAYRLADTSKVYESFGKEAIYTNGFFPYPDHVYTQLKAIELGRSFTNPKFQGGDYFQHSWKGIAKYMTMHPESAVLLGPVSLSKELPKAVQIAVLGYYKKQFGDLSTLPNSNIEAIQSVQLKPEFPFKIEEELVEFITDPKVREIVVEIMNFEGQPKELDTQLERLYEALGTEKLNIPQLYEKYTGMIGGRIISYNYDHPFNVIDGAVFVLTWEINQMVFMRMLGDKTAFVEYQETQNAIFKEMFGEDFVAHKLRKKKEKPADQ